MPKIELEMELTGLKIRFRGERDDLPTLKDSLQNQLTGLLPQVGQIAEDRRPPRTVEATVTPAKFPGSKTRRTMRARRPATDGEVTPSKAVTWQHDPNKWGNPRQSWSAWQKALWLLHVLRSEGVANELSGPVLAETFNANFREAELLSKQNMPRDLGKLKSRSPALLGSHDDASPKTWFLTDEGVKEAVKLVNDAKGISGQP